MQIGRLVIFSERTDCWCEFSWSVCNQNGHFIGGIQSISFQGYDAIHKSWEDIIKQYYRQIVAQIRINKDMCILHKSFHYFIHAR